VIDELERDDALVRIHASLVVERDSQKGIVIGQGWPPPSWRSAPTRAPRSSRLLGTQVFLDLRVTVLRKWQRDRRALERLGF
jgi:GTP-binding protein Era